MALFDTKGLSNKLGGMKEKVSGAISDAKLDEKFGKVRQQMGRQLYLQAGKSCEKGMVWRREFCYPI